MPLREFIVSPGFVGATVLVAALIVLGAVLYAVRRAGKRFDQELKQRKRLHDAVRDAEEAAQARQQSWQTFTWLVDTAGVEPAASEGATLGVGPELAMATLRGLLRDAERLHDETLADAVTAYQNQFARVLAQQAGPLSDLAGAPSAERKPPPSPAARPQPANAQDDKPDKKPVPDENASAAELAGDGRRHRR
ncbi:hypothetical protein [Mycolicibacterium sp. 120270]|uniref:hypothetical protein n=1 Tax=Mycolicibacterium sp. 120270 TaxID=3090600 RepID=UPI00299DE96C|nr:hypothetical protein [Mycolicibacterium sp. 120270]MDX1887323.1 hypothetical protein [Mycolicibacterium sp. 120270]